MWMLGEDSLFCQNLIRIQTAIVGLIETYKFMQDRGKPAGGYFEDQVWTLATVEAAIGTNLQTDPIKINEARFWQAQQDALDLLLYTKNTANWDRSSGACVYKGAPGYQLPWVAGYAALAPDSWASMVADSDHAGSISLPYIGYRNYRPTAHGPGEMEWSAFIREVSGMSVTVPDYAGDIVSAGYLVLTEYRNTTQPSLTCTYTGALSTILHNNIIRTYVDVGRTLGPMAMQWADIEIAPESAYLNTTKIVSMAVDSAVPAGWPFTDSTLHGDVRAYTPTNYYYMDLGSELSDQA